MHIRQLQYLQAIVAFGSFAAAARHAGVSQPTITLAMQALEREWGVALFQKVGRQKLPTHAALLAAQRAADLQGRLEGLARMPLNPLDDAVARGISTLHAGMAHAAALLYGPTIERVWRTHEPDGLLQIFGASVPELLTALHGKELDLVIAPRPRRYQSAGLKSHPLHTSTPTIYARFDHPLAGATSLTEIAHASWAVAGRAGTPGRVIEEAHRVRGLADPRILVQCDDYPVLLNLVAHSDLLCVVPHPVLRPPKGCTAVRALHIREGLPQYDVCVFWPSGKQSRSAATVDAVIRALKALVGSSDRQ
ncbi:MAG: LysR family transcriptional regulator [Rhodoferax sp.]|nr:LysR family transcriptional regulator [Rhodoferax sp.]